MVIKLISENYTGGTFSINLINIAKQFLSKIIEISLITLLT